MDKLHKKYYSFDNGNDYFGELLRESIVKEDLSNFVFEEKDSKKKELYFLVNQDNRHILLNQPRKFKVNLLAKIKEFSTQVLIPPLKQSSTITLYLKLKDFISRNFQSGSILRAAKNGNILDLGGIYSFFSTSSKEIGKTFHQKRNFKDVQLFNILKLGLILNKENEVFFSSVASRKQFFFQNLKKLLKIFNNHIRKMGEFNTNRKQKIRVRNKSVRILTKIQKKDNRLLLKKIKEIIVSFT